MKASRFRTDEARAAYCRLYDEAVTQSPIPVQQIDVDGRFGVTHVLAAGDQAKPPLVALHGKAFSSTMWLPLLPSLTDSHRVVMLDAVGDLNKSVARDVMSSPGRVVAWIAETVNALSIDSAAFVGASLGSWMAAHYAMACPSRVERLALVGPAGLVSRQHPRWLLRALFAVAMRPTPERIAAFVDSMAMPATAPRLREDPWRTIVRQFVDGSLTYRPRLDEPRPVRAKLGPLAGSSLPVLVIVGRNETLHDGPKMAKRFRDQLPRARVELLDEANHLVMIDQEERVADLLGHFFAAVPAPASDR